MHLYVRFALIALAVGFHNPAQADTGWRLVWSDEFDYTGLPDSSRCSYDVGGHGWGNGEEQFYTEGRTQNARVEDGVLTIEARREYKEGRPYTSARLVTKGKGDWTYGCRPGVARGRPFGCSPRTIRMGRPTGPITERSTSWNTLATIQT